MGWTVPYGSVCQNEVVRNSFTGAVSQIIRIGMDTSKYIFQLHGADASEPSYCTSG